MLKFLKKDDPFSNPTYAPADSPLAIGGDLSLNRLVDAYKKGIFPWFSEGEPVMWWSPDPRCVIFKENLKISKRLARKIRNSGINVTFNKAFSDVINRCAHIHRIKDGGTWITNSMIKAYIKLFEAGYCISAESWFGDKLVGGVYGVYINNVFSGESMFTIINDASKIAFVHLANNLFKNGCKLIDCQIPSEHMINFGATLIPRELFLNLLQSS